MDINSEVPFYATTYYAVDFIFIRDFSETQKDGIIDPDLSLSKLFLNYDEVKTAVLGFLHSFWENDEDCSYIITPSDDEDGYEIYIRGDNSDRLEAMWIVSIHKVSQENVSLSDLFKE